MRPGDHGTDPWEGTEAERPIDIEALHADDAFIESLMSGEMQEPARCHAGGSDIGGSDIDAELRSMLSAWVLDVRPETVTAVESASPATATATAATGPFAQVRKLASGEPGRSRFTGRYARRALVAASLVAVVSSGLALGAYQSEPGGTLWPMTKVLYAEHARSVQAAADVTTGLNRARTALKEGRTADAAEAIRAVRATLDQVAPAQGHDMLDQMQQDLSVQLATIDPKAATTLYLPPALGLPTASATATAPVGIPLPPLIDRAADSGSAPSVTPGTNPADGAVAATIPFAPVPGPFAPAPVRPADPVVPPLSVPDPAPSGGGGSSAVDPPASPATQPPVVQPPVVQPPATQPPVEPALEVPLPSPPVTVDPVPPVGTADPGPTDPGPAYTGPTDAGSAGPAAAPAATTDGAANAATAEPAPADPAPADPAPADPAPTNTTAGSLLATVTNAAADTAQTVESAAGGG